MGGYGAIMLGLRHPDMFISIGSTSGYLIRARSAAATLRKGSSRTPRRRTRQPNAEERAVEQLQNQPDPRIGIDGFSSYIERSPKGTMFATPEQADGYDPFTLIHQVPASQLPHIYLDCGTEDALIPFTHEFAQILLDKKIPFDFMQMPGGHDSNYWIQAIGHIMAVQYEVIQRALGQRPVGEK